MWSKSRGAAAARCSYSTASIVFGFTPETVRLPIAATSQAGQSAISGSSTSAYHDNFPSTSIIRKIIVPIVDFEQQTVVTCSKELIRRSSLIGSQPLWRYMFSDAQTLSEAFRRGLQVSNNGPCLGYREIDENGKVSDYKWLTYEDVLEKSENIARGLLTKGVNPGQSSFIGIYSRNRPEVVMTEQACYIFSMVVVSLYDTLGAEACRFILDQTELEVIFCDISSRAANLLAQKRTSYASKLRLIVLTEPSSDDLKFLAYEAGVELVTLAQLEQAGKEARVKLPPVMPILPKPDDLATICYTSGTSGNPKGAMITHANIIAATTASHMLKTSRIRRGDVMMSFLPMAHMYERLAQAIFLSFGGCIGFSRGDVRFLADDIKALRPHMLPSVPRLLNKVYDSIHEEVGDNYFKKWLLALAVHSKIHHLKNMKLSNDTVWDKLVFRRLQEQMGGRVKLLLSGSAPLSREVLHMLRAGMGAIVLEGYGATETAAACCMTMEGDVCLDHVGIPVPCNEIRLADVPEMNIDAKQGVGEIFVRGHNVFKGYFKDEENTLKSLTKDGWLKTGDICKWNNNGTLSLIDRKKYIIKLDQGIYVAPEKVESVYNRMPYISQSFVYGNNKKPYLIGIVIPDAKSLAKIVEKRFGIVDQPFEKLCKNEKVRKMIFDDMLLEGHEAGLQPFEQAKRIHLDSDLFTVENGLLTPTLKSRRVALLAKYKSVINKLYN